MPVGTRIFTVAEVEAIRNAPPGRTNVSLGREYGVSSETISRVRRGLTYRDIRRLPTATGAECPCPICLRRRFHSPVGPAPGHVNLSPRLLTVLMQFAREFDDISGDERWQAEDFVLYLDPRARDAA